MCDNYNNLLLLILLIYSLIPIIIIETREIENHWNVTKWWTENKDFDPEESVLKFDNRQQSLTFKPDKDSFKYLGTPGAKQRPDYYIPPQINENISKSDLIYSLESYDGSNSVIPRSSTKSILNTFYDYFSKIRSYRGNRKYYRQVKRDLKQKFFSFGLITALQSFWPPEIRTYSYKEKAHNIIGIWPGIYRGTSRDQIIIIGAHYDTVRSSPGVDDNGSGCTAVLEIAKLISENNCKLETTLIFVLFDMEEDGLKGSKYFVKDYLIPVEINRNGVKVLAVIILDMILEHDITPNSQSLGPVGNVLPEWSESVQLNGYRGDFAAVWARKGIDTHLFEILHKNWMNQSKYKLSLMDPTMPELGQDIDSRYTRYRKYETFMRSDHASFWYPTQKDVTFNAILITDLGPWRRNMKHNYHKSSDDTRTINQNNLSFIKNTIDSIINTIIDLSNGKCFK